MNMYPFHQEHYHWPDSIFFEYIQNLHLNKYTYSTILVYWKKIRIFGQILQSLGYSENSDITILVDITIFKTTLYKYHSKLLKNKSKLGTVSSLNQYIMSWQNFRRWFCRERGIKSSNLKIHYFKKPDCKPEILQLSQFTSYQPFDDSDYQKMMTWCIFDLMCNAGLRVTEIMKLQIRNFKIKEQVIILDKRFRQSRTIYLDLVSTTYLQKYLRLHCLYYDIETLNPKFPMFTMKCGNAITYKKIRKIVCEFTYDTFGKKITPRVLRSSCVFHYLTETKDTRAVQEFMGYLSLNSVLKYYRYDITPLREELKKAPFRFQWNPKDTF